MDSSVEMAYQELSSELSSTDDELQNTSRKVKLKNHVNTNEEISINPCTDYDIFEQPLSPVISPLSDNKTISFDLFDMDTSPTRIMTSSLVDGILSITFYF